MHTSEDFSIGGWIESTLNYKNEDVFVLYAVVLLVSLVVCILPYKKACSTQNEMHGDKF